PNQLGYFALLSMAIFTVVPSIYRRNKIILFLIASSCAYLVLLSESRASFVGILLLAAIVFWNEGFSLNLRSLVYLSILSGVCYIAVNSSDYMTMRINSVLERNQSKASTLES